MTHSPLDNLQESMQRAGEAFARAAEALGDFCRAYVDAVSAIANGPDFSQLRKIVNTQAALKEAPPRVRHLAKNSKKLRTQKKNINRALREYQRRKK